jgi:hypothetical protein
MLPQLLLGGGSILASLFGGGQKWVTAPWAEQLSQDLMPFLSDLNNEIKNFKPGPAQKFFKRGTKSLLRGEDFSKNPVAAPYLAMRAAEAASQGRAIERSARDVAVNLPPGAEHLSGMIRQEMQNEADASNAIEDAVGVSNLVAQIPQLYQTTLMQNAQRKAGLRGQYLSGQQLRGDVLSRGTTREQTGFGRVMQGIAGGLSMLPGLMNSGMRGGSLNTHSINIPPKFNVPGINPGLPMPDYRYS